MTKEEVTRAAYNSLRQGDYIPTRELNIAIATLEPTVELLGKLGMTFQLPWKELWESLNMMRDFKAAREK